MQSGIMLDKERRGMEDFSVLIGGKAGFGIDKSGSIIARILSQLSYRIYIYRDYPSIIRGGHTFSIIRASAKRISAHQNKVDFILALNQDTVDFHKARIKENSLIIYDSDSINPEGLPQGTQTMGIPLKKITEEENAPEVMRNTAIIAAFCKSAGIGWEILDTALKREIGKEIEANLRVARRGYDLGRQTSKVEALSGIRLPLLSGNEAIGLGLVKGGLTTYIAYPMTPSSPILHFLADVADDFGLKVIHPESEIGVILMALGFSYMGERVAVGTSGGGFCLMTEGLSFSGMSELPVVIILGQRPGPSTGLPTYSAQTELNFALYAGQGEFPRLVVSPGDPQEAYFWSALSLNLSWKYQIPAIILSDKNLGEGLFSFDADSVQDVNEEGCLLWNRNGEYKRYQETENGVSPLAFAPDRGGVIKINSYEHDEYGITTEDPLKTKAMQDKRMRKEKYLAKELEKYETVKSYAGKSSSTALLCWGSNKGVCIEVAEKLGLKVIQPLIFSPFPLRQLQDALGGIKKIISVENNATAQLAGLLKAHGFDVDEKILRYDGRPFSVEELEGAVGGVLS